MNPIHPNRFSITCRFQRLRAIVLALSTLLPATPAMALDVPYLTGRVVDNAEILSPDARQRLTEKLKQHEEATTNQIAVLTVASLEGESIEDFAVHVFKEWKLGQKGKDNGVLVVVAPKDRRMRIEVGYGLEGTLTDVASSRIIRNVMTPKFKDGDYDGGVEAGVTAIIAVLNGEAPPNDSAEQGGSAETSSANKNDEFFKGPPLSLSERILMGGFIFGIIGLFTIIGIMTPGVGWFLYLFLIPFWSMFPIMVVGTHPTLIILVTYLVGYPLVKIILSRSAWYKKAGVDLRTKGTAQIGGFTMTSGGGSSWSSGSSSSGGFSGGGGSSGGGGASGSW